MSSSVTRIEIGTREGFVDARGVHVKERARDHLGIALREVRTRDVYLIEAELEPAEAERVAREFAGPVLREGAVDRLPGEDFDVAVSVGYRPGVTDPVGKSARVAVEDILGRPLGDGGAVFNARLYLLSGVSKEEAERVAKELLANEVIEEVRVQTLEEWRGSEPERSVPRVADAPTPSVETVSLEGDDETLLAISRERLLALTLEEMAAIRDHFREQGGEEARRRLGLGPEPTDVELECLAQTWSEHCKHKIMNATIVYEQPGSEPQTVRSLFKTAIRGTTERIDSAIREREGKSWLVSLFHDNAGVIAATKRHHLVFKVETHNSPSALDPYGGAITGIVGVNRDPFGTGLGSDLLVNTWGYCFASPRHEGELPPGILHPRRIRDGVHAGVVDGGNQSGIPYGRGFELFDERYLGKPLVYCGTVGRMPVEVAGEPGHVKRCQPGDRIVMVGGRIGKDGIHGATFSSAELTESSPVAAVQIGDPITQKMMFDFLLEARERGLYSAITDNGAGGLSSSVGEMAEAPGGARLDLARAPLKYRGLAPWEILVSEAQERMTLAVPPDKLEELLALAEAREVEATELGEFTDSAYLHVLYGDESVAYLALDFLHEGLPEMRIEARFAPAEGEDDPAAESPEPGDFPWLLSGFLARENLATDETLYRRYDHEVKGQTIVKPLVGRFGDVPADASVFLVEHGSWAGFALAEGVFPYYSDIDAHAMAQAGVDLAVRRLIAAGARFERIAALDNYCWPDPLPAPNNPDAAHKAAQLVRASFGLAEICEAYGVPLISGKDSMKNDAVVGGRRISIPPTLLCSAIGLLDDARRGLTLEPGGVGQRLVLVGETRRELGASEWARHRGGRFVSVPRCDPERFAARYRLVADAIAQGLVSAAHAPGLGGLLPALFRMARAGDLGLAVDLTRLPVAGDPGWEGRLFSETPGRLLLTCDPAKLGALLAALGDEPAVEIGTVTASRRLRLDLEGETLADVEVSRLADKWRSVLSAPRGES